MTTYCEQTKCRHCSIDKEIGTTVCIGDPIFIRMPESRSFILKCNTYQKRDPGETIKPITNVMADGLYPGQIRPGYDPYAEEEEKEEGECKT
jgi:hypothetical protein